LLIAAMPDLFPGCRNLPVAQVRAEQNDLVTVLGQFDPELVKIAPSGERPED